MRELAEDALATLRLCRLLSSDAILDRPREAALASGPDWLSRLLACPWCLSMWVGAGVVAARRGAPRLWGPAARALALSAAAALASRVAS